MGSNCEDVGRDGGAVDAADGVPTVSDCCDDDDSGLPGPLDGGRERIVGARGNVGQTERQIEHPDVQTVVVLVLDDPVDGGDDLLDVGDAVGSGDLHAHDAAVRCDAADLVAVVAGDDACEVRAVAEGVEVDEVRHPGFSGEVGSVHDLAGLVEARNGCDARVDQRHIDALAAETLLGQLSRRLLGDDPHRHGFAGPDGHRQRHLSGVIGGGFSGCGLGVSEPGGGECRHHERGNEHRQ